MINRYSLVDDESGLTIGKSLDLVGLTGNLIETVGDENFHKIMLIHFRYNVEFVAYCKEKKININNIEITILDYEENSIGSYYFVLREPLSYNRFTEFNEVLTQFELVGDLSQVATEESMLIWNMRRKPLAKTNEWVGLSLEQRIGWLEVARLYRGTQLHSQERQNGIYHMDATNIEDSSSFYCALGEAINGPGGYYGFNLDSLSDCFCGGFGAIAPFRIVFQDVDHERCSNEGYFQQLKEVLADGSVTLVFS
ncbi:barstar family protein [Paenibacillus sp. FSL K6-1558]|uniref:barstar family protein n=1 Tax=Paenibacillus sp. FSL K6-1558 TaxID=2921473 RepID=UPI0012B88009|nr:barstar family protein [Paenibacillus xylanexedens]